jgi:uncharacterized membrane protein
MNTKSQPNPDTSLGIAARQEQRNIPIESEALPEHIIKNVETIDKYHTQSHQDITADRRILNKIAGIFSRPQFLYFQVGFFALWIGCTQLAERNIIAKNFPQFELGLHGLEVVSLLITTEVLIAQAHQEKVAEERSHLMLQLNLVTEQKIAKSIALLEELRIDLPNVKNRHDLEAQVMQQASDPQVILEAIQQISEQSPDSEPKTEVVST